ncbi:hypothetical protein ACFYU9_33895 [Streptomyces sp. NPDC004327]|uniref:hypothetical protein n=1 Tax=Streptomyces sp. NPDC004327 TaxID=3364699 RepID=UPI0036B2F926
MYGQGYPPPLPQPPQQQRAVPASVVVLRVLFAVLPLLSIGFLTWATALRIALLTRKVWDWLLLVVSVAVVFAGLVLMPDDPDAPDGDWVVGMILLNAVAFTVYFLVTDIRHDRAPAAPAPALSPYNPYAATVPSHHHGYGYPPVQPAPQPVAPPTAQPRPQPRPQPVAPPNPRIHQVRAELDELSDLLRQDARDPRDPRVPREGGR